MFLQDAEDGSYFTSGNRDRPAPANFSIFWQLSCIRVATLIDFNIFWPPFWTRIATLIDCCVFWQHFLD